MKKKRAPQQVISVGPLPPGAADQHVFINPTDGQPPNAGQYPAAGSTSLFQIIIAVAVGGFLLLAGCALVTALTAGAIW